MCLVLRFETKEEAHHAVKNPMRATTDIYTWKRIHVSGESEWNYNKGFRWEIGRYYNEKMNPFIIDRATSRTFCWQLCVSFGLHSFAKKPALSWDNFLLKVIRTKIPKGAYYYYNKSPDYEYVSDELIYLNDV